MPSKSQALSRPGTKPHSGAVPQGPQRPVETGPLTELAPKTTTVASTPWRCNSTSLIPTQGRDLLPAVFIFSPLFKVVPRVDLARQNTIHMIWQLVKLTIASLYFNHLNPPLMYPFKNKQFAVNQRQWGKKQHVKREKKRLQNKTDCPEPLKLRKAECQAGTVAKSIPQPSSIYAIQLARSKIYKLFLFSIIVDFGVFLMVLKMFLKKSYKEFMLKTKQLNGI